MTISAWAVALVVAMTVMLGGVGAVFAPQAAAHDVVLKAEPGDGSTVAEFPRTITLEFSGIPQANFNTLAVSNADTKEVLFTAQPTLVDNFVSIDVPATVDPGDGNYIVGFQITSSDGHATRGKTSFTVGPVETTTPSASATESPQEKSADATSSPATSADAAAGQQGGSSLGMMVGIAAIVIVVAVAAVALLRRRSSRG